MAALSAALSVWIGQMLGHFLGMMKRRRGQPLLRRLIPIHLPIHMEG